MTLACLAAVALLTGGCQLAVDPFTDELANRPAVTTPSVEGTRAADAAPNVPALRGEPTEVFAKTGAVWHGPLYFEDSVEGECGPDDPFAWTGADYLDMLLGRVRFLCNTLLFPINVIRTPPWAVMESDGRPSRRVLWMKCDAERRVDAG